AGAVAEQAAARGAEKSDRAAKRSRRTKREGTRPLHLSGPIVHRLQRVADRSNVAFGRGPSLRAAIGILEIHHAERLPRAEIQQPSIGIEAWRGPVRRAGRVGRGERPWHARIFSRISNRLSFRVDRLRPVERIDEARRDEMLAGRAIEQHVVAVAARLRDELTWTAVD